MVVWSKKMCCNFHRRLCPAGIPFDSFFNPVIVVGWVFEIVVRSIRAREKNNATSYYMQSFHIDNIEKSELTDIGNSVLLLTSPDSFKIKKGNRGCLSKVHSPPCHLTSETHKSTHIVNDEGREWIPEYFQSASSKVLPARRSPVSYPFLNQYIRCSEVP
jgi:hypothetical protein